MTSWEGRQLGWKVKPGAVLNSLRKLNSCDLEEGGAPVCAVEEDFGRSVPLTEFQPSFSLFSSVLDAHQQGWVLEPLGTELGVLLGLMV